MINKIKRQFKALTVCGLFIFFLFMVNGCGSKILIAREASGYRIAVVKGTEEAPQKTSFAPAQTSASSDEEPDSHSNSSPVHETLTMETRPLETVTPKSDDSNQNESVSINESKTAHIAEEVSDKNGLTPIQESSEQIDPEEAREDLTQSQGQTGDDLAFDPLFYPYYAMLDPASQALYRQIYANASELNAVFSPVEEVTARQLGTVFQAVYNDHPELFWLDNSYSYKYLANGICVEATLGFNETAGNLDSAKQLFNQSAEAVLSGAEALENDFEKELFIHDYLVEKADYVTNSPFNQSAYSALVTGQTVCSGYARAFQYLLKQLHIPCYLATGYSKEDHAWNIVKLGDGYYNVDVTWDDVDSGIYEFFNKTDRDFNSTHIRQDLSVGLPACNGGEYSGIAPDKRPNPEDMGVSTEDALYTLEDYYMDCYSQIMEQGTGTIEFANLIPASLWEVIENAYHTKEYRYGYADRAMGDLSAHSYQVSVDAEELKGDYYLLRHTAEIK